MGGSRDRIRKARKRFLRKARPFVWTASGLFTIWWYFSIPSELFTTPYATVTESSDGRLMGARIAMDGQWRFPLIDSVPEKFEACITHFEDRNFRYHPGVDPIAIFRAISQNLQAGEVVSGASTLSMQVIRLSRNNPSRTYFEKITEMLRATRLEAGYTKDEILRFYASHAPFGGNVVGLDAASWRYFRRAPNRLSWAEMASLAVLPNDPSNIRPDRNREAYKAKRDRLLLTLLNKEVIDSTTYRISLREPLPSEPYALPDISHHLTERQNIEHRGKRIKTDIEYDRQFELQAIVDLQANRWRRNQVHNSAAMIMELETGKVIAYVGNTINPESDGFEIDMLQVPRSTGSILKPFLYSEAMGRGLISPRSLLTDIPTRIGSFTPENFDEIYRGAVTAEQALQLSLNVPAVRTLRRTGVGHFHDVLKRLGMNDLNLASESYGLSLILGGGEVRPAQILDAYRNWILVGNQDDYTHTIWGDSIRNPSDFDGDPVSVYNTLQMMEGVERPAEWRYFGRAEGRRIAWKTGTSYGFRDAWSVGTDGRYLVVAWTGNATNEGRPGVIGVETSAPMLFRIFSTLPSGDFIEEPLDEEKTVQLCAQSGFRAGVNCSSSITEYVGFQGVEPCPFCKHIYLNKDGERTSLNCAEEEVLDTTWMILPAGMAYYAMRSGSGYVPLPAWSENCYGGEEEALEWIYPAISGEMIKQTRDLDGVQGPVVLEAGHRIPDATLFWSVDGEFIAQTRGEHRLKTMLSPGIHYLTIADEQGNTSTVQVEVLD